MKNLLIPLLFLLLGIWIWGGGMMWKNNACCGGAISGLSVRDGATLVAANEAKNFHFALSGHQPMELAGVKDEMQKVATYLKNHPDRQLTVEGRYLKDEKNNSTYANLGLARAHSIIQHLVDLGAPAAQVVAGAKLMDALNFSNDKTYDAIAWNFAERQRGISFVDEVNNFKATFADDFQFAKSSADYSTPLSPGLTTTIGKTAEYLKKTGNRAMVITGFYTDGEENNSILPDLGLARANAIKKTFTDLGVAPNQINIASQKRTLDFGSGLSTAATYHFTGMEASGDRLSEVEKRLKAKPLILYFETGKNTLSLNPEQRQYMADLIYYLDNKKGASVTATGHTDNVGNARANVRLSRKRAEFAKDYLVRNNINAAKIKVDGKGPNQPTASNDTAEGRAKNRRVELSIH